MSLQTKTLFISLAITLILIPGLAIKGYPSQFVVNSDDINVRCDSTVNSLVICKLNKGSAVEVISEFYGWYKIRLPKNAPSFVKKNLVEILETKPAASFAMPGPGVKLNETSARVIKDKINIRLTPSESSPILGKAEKGELLKIIKAQGDWYKIEAIKNSFGWINKRFVNEIKSAAEQNKEIAMPRPQGKIKDVLSANNTVAISENILTLEGIVKPNGVFFNRAATHKLVDKDNKAYLLKADKTLLNSYSYHRVKVTGRLLNSPKKALPLVEATKIELIE